MAKEQVFIGIDPGAKGALCALMPKKNKAAFFKTTENPADILQWFKDIGEEADIRAIMIEDVHSIFGASAKSNFNFGYNVGVVNTLALASGCMVDKVTPKKWQKAVGVKSTSKGKDIKKDVANICARLYAKTNIHGPRGGLDDGKSDALMIAHYCYLIHKME